MAKDAALRADLCFVEELQCLLLKLVLPLSKLLFLVPLVAHYFVVLEVVVLLHLHKVNDLRMYNFVLMQHTLPLLCISAF